MKHTEIIKKTRLYKVEEGYFTANYRGKIYSIGELLYVCLNNIQENKSLDDISLKINKDYNLKLNASFLEESIDGFVDRIENSQKQSNTLYNYIYFKIKILGEKTIAAITSITSPLFNKYLLMILTPIAIILSVRLLQMIMEDGILNKTSSLSDTFVKILLMYGGIAVLGLIHEFGHSSSAAYFKQPSTSIGFGFYIVFPVFYTDVSKIWNIDRMKRIAVNLGGIYFQLLLNIVFFFLYISIESMEFKIVLKQFIIANVVLFIYAINPFFRNDGYWVYSDFFKIPNLIEEAMKFPKVLTTKLKEEISFKEKRNYLSKNFPLLIYSLSLYIIMTGLIVALIFLTFKNIKTIRDFLRSWDMIDWSSYDVYKQIFGMLFEIFINVYFGVKMIKQYIFK